MTMNFTKIIIEALVMGSEPLLNHTTVKSLFMQFGFLRRWFLRTNIVD